MKKKLGRPKLKYRTESVQLRLQVRVVRYWKNLAKDNGYKYTALMTKALSQVLG